MDEQPSALTHVLLARYRDGDKSALDILCKRYYPRVKRIVRARLGAKRLAREEVDDYVQDVFVRVIQSAEQFEHRSDARWIDRVARMVQNEISNHARRDRTLKRGGEVAREIQQCIDSAAELQVAADTTAVPLKAARHEEEALVDECVAELSEDHREVITLRRHAGADWQTVAELMGRPSAEACQELFRRALRELAEKWQQRS